ncbi:MAG: DUF3267 domain-containing protein [Clostridiales bacterium]|nr:DUF3267 domain-containing protein [Clostridiales bacterium]
MKNVYEYKAVSRLNMLDPRLRLLHKLNTFAVIAIVLSCLIGAVLNYCLRMLGEAFGMYIVYILCGVVLCLIYPYVHEYAHAFAILITTGKAPKIRFEKLAAYCGSPDIMFNKAQYFFGASFPFIFYNAALIPLCVLLPPIYFPLPFMPLMYNVFGSVADFIMIIRVARSPFRSIIVDGGTDIVIYIPVDKK